MPQKKKNVNTSSTELEDIDELQLEIRKEEKKRKPPLPMYQIILVFFGILLVTYAIVVSIAKIISNALPTDPRDFSEWLIILLMVFGGLAIFGGGISGAWGGQRNIPIRMVSPSTASVVGKGLIVTGYAIEECLDNEIELTIYDKDKEVIYEEIVPVLKEGLFYTKLDTAFSGLLKSTHIIVEAWMVSITTKKILFAIREKKLNELNVAKAGLKIGKLHFFPIIFKSYTDKAKIVYDPKRKEKGVIENVKLNESKTTNIFFPEDNSNEKFIPFSMEKVAEMRQNALYFDIKRKRRFSYSLILIVMAGLYFLYPIIAALISG